MSQRDVELLRRGWEAFGRGDVDAAVGVLDLEVRWYAAGYPDGEGACHNRDDAASFLRRALADGMTADLLDVRDAGDRLVAVIHTHAPPEWNYSPEPHGELVTVRNGRITEMVVYPTVEDALAAVGSPRHRRPLASPPAPRQDQEAMEPVVLQPVDSLTVTMLMDNVTDSLLADQGPAKRPSMATSPRRPARFLVGGDTDDALRGEHGFSALVTIAKGGRETRVLFDAGRTPDGVVENMRRLELSPHDIDIIVLSHGHWDHTTGMDGLVRELGRPNMPVLIHPEFWSRRRLAFPGRDPVELPTTSKSALEGAGFEIVEERQPSFLLDGSLLVTGEVDRTTDFERGFPGHEAHRHGAWQPDPLILDDQALVAKVRGHGLVVLTGCGHSGIINILHYARKITGENRIHAVLGGFHLSGPALEPIIRPTCDALGEFSPDYLIPAHCTGWGATHVLAARFPEAFIQNSVGTRYEFAASDA